MVSSLISVMVTLETVVTVEMVVEGACDIFSWNVFNRVATALSIIAAGRVTAERGKKTSRKEGGRNAKKKKKKRNGDSMRQWIDGSF